MGSIPGQGTKIPYAVQYGERKRKKKSHDIRNAAAAAAAAKSLQSCPTLCDPRDNSLPSSPMPGILQARTLEWVAISFSDIRNTIVIKVYMF